MAWYEQNYACGYTDIKQRYRETSSTEQPVFDVRHSVGEHGAFIWMDLDTETQKPYYGIFIMYFNWYLMLFNGVCLLCFFTLVCCCVSCCVGYKKNNDLENSLLKE